MPCPYPRCWLSRRDEVEGVRVGEPLRVPVGGGEHDEYGIARRDPLPAERQRLGGEPPGRELHRPVVAQQFLDAGGQQLRSPRRRGTRWSRSRCSGLRSRAYIPLPMRLTVVSKPAKRRMKAMAAASFSVRCSPWSLARISPEIRSSPGLLPLAVDEFGEIAAHLLHRAGHTAARPAAVPDHHARPVPEVVLVLARDAEQVADGVDGERERELVDEVRLPLLRRSRR